VCLLRRSEKGRVEISGDDHVTGPRVAEVTTCGRDKDGSCFRRGCSRATHLVHSSSREPTGGPASRSGRSCCIANYSKYCKDPAPQDDDPVIEEQQVCGVADEWGERPLDEAAADLVDGKGRER
jgi:hypothetical protein